MPELFWRYDSPRHCSPSRPLNPSHPETATQSRFVTHICHGAPYARRNRDSFRGALRMMTTIPHLTTKQHAALYRAWLHDADKTPAGRRTLRSTLTVARGLVALGLLAEHPDRSPRGEVFFFLTRHGLEVAEKLFAPDTSS